LWIWKLAAKYFERQTVLPNLHPLKSDRGHVDLSNDAVARHWTKRFGRTKKEIAAAIAKVGNNPDTVAKELGSRESERPSRQRQSAKHKSASSGAKT
jgi:hypothetical protein